MIRIIPAIDIMEGKCVRLTRGDYNTRVIYDEDPIRVARTFEDAGIEYLHLVDLDGARMKQPVNLTVLDMIAQSTSLKIDFGGGIRKHSHIEQILSLGAQQVTAGSIAIKNRTTVEKWLTVFGPDKIILGADVLKDKIAVSGWSEKTEINIISFLDSYVEKGIHYIICTQILRDGVLSGPDLLLYQQIKETFPDIFLIASGGVANISDIYLLDDHHIDGVIIGKALYENKIMLTELEPFLC